MHKPIYPTEGTCASFEMLSLLFTSWLTATVGLLLADKCCSSSVCARSSQWYALLSDTTHCGVELRMSRASERAHTCRTQAGQLSTLLAFWHFSSPSDLAGFKLSPKNTLFHQKKAKINAPTLENATGNCCLYWNIHILWGFAFVEKMCLDCNKACFHELHMTRTKAKAVILHPSTPELLVWFVVCILTVLKQWSTKTNRLNRWRWI